MQAKTIILMGSQGSGKGTQLKKLHEHFDAQNEAVSVFQTGDMFRALQEEDSFVSRKIRETLDGGAHQPLVLSVSLWGYEFVRHIDPAKHQLIDGFPRRLEEAKLLDEMLHFCERTPVDVVYFDVDEKETIRRMKARNRADDTDEAIEKRITFYKTCTAPIIPFYKSQESYRVHHIDGNKKPDEVERDMFTALDLPYTK